jgi:hypothetical protein
VCVIHPCTGKRSRGSACNAGEKGKLFTPTIMRRMYDGSYECPCDNMSHNDYHGQA